MYVCIYICVHFLRVSVFTLDASRIRARAKKHRASWQSAVLIRLLSDNSFYEVALKYHEFYVLKYCVIFST